MQFSIVSLNVWALPGSLSRHTLARMAAIGQRLSSLDVDAFAFQEVWTPQARALLVEAGQRSGHSHVWDPDESQERGGVLVLSRHPVREAEFTRFSLCGLPQRVHHADYYSGKGVARVILETPEGPLCVAVTHFHASYGWHGLEDEYRGHRGAQAIEVAWALRDVEVPVVLGGDLNTYATEPEIRMLLGLAGLTDVAAALRNEQETVLPFSPYRPNEDPPGPRIDYVLSRAGRARGLRPLGIERVLDEEFEIDGQLASYSDHAGLRARFELDERGAPAPVPPGAAMELARGLIQEGRDKARTRRNEQRLLAGGAGASALGLLAAAHRVETSRRGALLYAAGGLGLLVAGCLGTLAEGFTPRELRSYRLVEKRLGALYDQAAQQ